MENAIGESTRIEASLKNTEVRDLLKVSAPTLSDLYRRLDVSYVSKEAKRGSAKSIGGSQVRKILNARGFKYPSPSKIVAFMMTKGGVGKTTSTFYLSQRLTAYGAKVLAVDADPQGNLTSAFNFQDDIDGFEIDGETPVLVDIVERKATLGEATICVTPNLHLIPSTPNNAILESRIDGRYKNLSLMVEALLGTVKQNYDYILIDCGPALNKTNFAIVAGSDLAVMPVSPDKFSQVGLEQTLREISDVKREFKDSKVEPRIVLTRFDARENTSLKYLSDIVSNHDDIRFKSVIRTSSDVKNAIVDDVDLFGMKKSNAREDYDALAKELMGLDVFFQKTNSK